MFRKNTNQIDKSLQITQFGAFTYYEITFSKILELSLTYLSLGVTVSFCKFWFDTLIQV